MKAAIYTKYGGPEVLQVKEVEKPFPKDNEVLVKVHAVSINDWDWQLLLGLPVAAVSFPGFQHQRSKYWDLTLQDRLKQLARM